MTEHVLTPVAPYSLAQSLPHVPSGPWRRTQGGIAIVMRTAAGPAYAEVTALLDGTLHVRLDSEDDGTALAELRFLLATEDDHRPFLDIARDDPLLGRPVSQRRGLRPLRTSTVTQSLVHALAGQLITAREAFVIERRISTRLATRFRDLLLPLTPDQVASVPPAEFVRLGLAPKRAAALARIVRTIDLEGLRTVDAQEAGARLARERMIGPWSIGVMALAGFGSYAHGMVGDLNLIRLCANLAGRPATAEDTAALLSRYGPWAGLASVHLMRHPLAHRRGHRAA